MLLKKLYQVKIKMQKQGDKLFGPIRRIFLKPRDFKDLMREMLSFFSARIFTIILSALISYIFVDTLHWPNMPVQIAAAIIVVILNYVFSKLFIFKGNK